MVPILQNAKCKTSFVQRWSRLLAAAREARRPQIKLVSFGAQRVTSNRVSIISSLSINSLEPSCPFQLLLPSGPQDFNYCSPQTVGMCPWKLEAHIPTAFARQFPGAFQLLLVVPEGPEGLSGTGVRRRASRPASRQ